MRRKPRLKPTKSSPKSLGGSKAIAASETQGIESALYADVCERLDPATLAHLTANVRYTLFEAVKSILAVHGKSNVDDTLVEVRENFSALINGELSFLASSAVGSTADMFERCLASLMIVATQGTSSIAEYAFREVVQFATRMAKWVDQQSKDPAMSDVVMKVAKDALEWPLVHSPFPQTSKQYRRSVAVVPVGMKVPMKIASNKSLNALNRLAVGVLRRVDFWRRKPGSPLLKVIPQIENLPFCSDKPNAERWHEAAAFFMDLVMAPEERSDEIAKSNGLTAELAHLRETRARLEEETGVCLRTSLDYCGTITEMPEFQDLLTSDRDKTVQSTAKLYHRVKSKVLEQIASLRPDPVA